MNELPPPLTKSELLSDFQRDWDELMRVVESANSDDLMSRTDAAGWNSRDHLAHLGAWIRGLVSVIRDGRPQAVGIGIAMETFNTPDIDAINESIRQLTIHEPVATVLTNLRADHIAVIAQVEGMSDDELARPVSAFLDGGWADPISVFLNGDGPRHYREHTEYISRILKP